MTFDDIVLDIAPPDWGKPTFSDLPAPTKGGRCATWHLPGRSPLYLYVTPRVLELREENLRRVVQVEMDGLKKKLG